MQITLDLGSGYKLRFQRVKGLLESGEDLMEVALLQQRVSKTTGNESWLTRAVKYEPIENFKKLELL